MRCAVTIAAGLVAFCLGTPAEAGIEDWEVNEVVTQVGGDVQIRYVELRNLVGGCMFPTTRLEAYDAAGQSVGSTSLVVSTTCWGPDTYLLLATSAAQTAFDTDADRAIVPSLPVDGGQLCFKSSATEYDCVRWGAITSPVHDFFGTADSTVAAIPAGSDSLSRVATTHVVSADWVGLPPTPRGPNDGTPWSPPDAGPSPDAGPDAGPIPDAAPRPDAFVFPDARARVDARGNRFLDLEPRGDGCGCRAGEGAGGTGLLVVFAVLLAVLRPRLQLGKERQRLVDQI